MKTDYCQYLAEGQQYLEVFVLLKLVHILRIRQGDVGVLDVEVNVPAVIFIRHIQKNSQLSLIILGDSVQGTYKATKPATANRDRL